jgi:hypothetical protein
MTTNLRRSIFVALALIGAALAWRTLGRDSADVAHPRKDARLLYDRVWIDSKPDKHTDYVHAFFILEGAPICVFQKASSYDMHLELCEHNRDGAKVRVHFPQRKQTSHMGYSIRACDELPPFDLCLDLDHNPWGGPKRYYSSTDADAADLAGVEEHLRSHLAHE